MNFDIAMRIVQLRNEAVAQKVAEISTSAARQLIVLTIDSYFVVKYDEVQDFVSQDLKLIAKAMLDNYDTTSEILVLNNKDLLRVTK